MSPTDAVLGITKAELDAQFQALAQDIPEGPMKAAMRAQYDQSMARIPDDARLPFAVPAPAPAEPDADPVDDDTPAPDEPQNDTAAAPAPDVLTEAHALIWGDREDTYGDPRESFARIAGMWSAYLGHPVTPLDVANLMICMKVSRTRHAYHRDSYVDIGGYAASAERVAS
ncbi:DUF6378 domain-containing protein [Nocardia carnea]|uniref:DUF6378 domain-containing protein n=1 Tax=Nocardia carnea TaxID=37328 RepID=UPI0024570AA7|nr:DUF6378 domain-containing protein [Nocardia carnea]